MAHNYLLLYSIEDLLSKANPKRQIFGKSAFYKLLFLLDIRLKEKGLDIKLPYSWYRFGTIPDVRSFRYITGIEFSTYSPFDPFTPFTPPTTYFLEPTDYPIGKSEKDTINREIDDLLNDFNESDYLNIQIPEKLLNSVYQYAPSEFHRFFGRFLLPYLEISNNEQDSPIPNRDEVTRILDHLLKIYPKKEMPELYQDYIRWDDTINLALQSDDKQILYQMSKEFWYVFTYLSRVKFNENIIPEQIERWEREFYTIFLPEFKLYLEKNREQLLLKYGKYDESNELISDFVQKTNELSRKMAIQ